MVFIFLTIYPEVESSMLPECTSLEIRVCLELHLSENSILPERVFMKSGIYPKIAFIFKTAFGSRDTVINQGTYPNNAFIWEWHLKKSAFHI